MNFGEAIASCFKQYVVFQGRSCRSEFWFWVLFTLIAGIVTGILDFALFPGNEISPLNTIFSLATILPSLAVGARRLHDIDRSAWWLLLWFAVIVGWIILIIWAIKAGDEASNRFGSDPLAAATA